MTSAGAPWMMLWARVSLPPKLKVTVVPGWAASNSLPSSVKVFFSEAAAKTVTLPLTAAPEPEEDEEAPTHGLRVRRAS